MRKQHVKKLTDLNKQFETVQTHLDAVRETAKTSEKI